MVSMDVNNPMDQIAFASYSDNDTLLIKERLGLLDARWVRDLVVAYGDVNGHKATNIAHLEFCYHNGLEIEILRYVEGPNYLEHNNVPAGQICHVSYHHNAGILPEPKFPIIQQVETQSHTNPFLVEQGRKYRYTIYDSYALLGVHLKVIERIDANGHSYAGRKLAD